MSTRWGAEMPKPHLGADSEPTSEETFAVLMAAVVALLIGALFIGWHFGGWMLAVGAAFSLFGLMLLALVVTYVAVA